MSEFLAGLLQNEKGHLNWIALVGGAVAFLIGILPLIAAIWKAFYPIFPNSVGVKYRRQKPHVIRFGEHKGLVFLSHSAIRFAMFGWREWKQETMSYITTATATIVLDLPDGTQEELQVSFRFGLIPQAEGYYRPGDINLVKLVEAKQGTFDPNILEMLKSELGDGIKAQKLGRESLTSPILFHLLEPLVVEDLANWGLFLNRVNVGSANKTLGEKLSSSSGIGPGRNAAALTTL